MASTPTAGEALVAGEFGAALEVVQQEGDAPGFELSAAVADAFLEKGATAGELGDFGFDEAAFLLETSVADDFGVGLPVGQLMGRFCEGVEPCRPSSEKLEEPGPHGVGGDA